MFGPAGFSYVYFTYGMHYCFNIVTGEVGRGSAVLVRAVEPLYGRAIIETNRFPKTGFQLTNGPAKVCQALNINKELNHHNLSEEPFMLKIKPRLPDSMIIVSTRIGISKATDKPWRFYIAGNPYVSKL
jgi:DNA-3-methyladenine glycosylase